jgi:hypothetical protein
VERAWIRAVRRSGAISHSQQAKAAASGRHWNSLRRGAALATFLQHGDTRRPAKRDGDNNRWTVAAHAALPALQLTSGGPRPDSPSNGPLAQDASGDYPTQAVKSRNEAPPEAGATVQVFSLVVTPQCRRDFAQNPAWQEVNRHSRRLCSSMSRDKLTAQRHGW